MTQSLTFKGFNYTSYYNGGFTNANSLNSLVSTGANSVALTTAWGIDAQTSEVYADPLQTDSLATLGDTILQAESLGLSVMVRPLVDLFDPTDNGTLTGEWRDAYNPTDPAAFFASYKTMIVSEAEVAQQDGAQILCIGSELDQLTGPAYLSEWTDIISAVRAVYSGKLTYGANWDVDISPWTYGGAPAGTGDFTTQISFWKQLDYIGIDQYAAISDIPNPTLADLIAGWTQPPTNDVVNQTTGGQSLIAYYQSLSATLDMPILITEMGYQNATDAAASEGKPSTTGVEDDALQANLYQAFFDALQQSGDGAIEGTYFWNWDPNTAEVGPGNGINWSPQGLPAQQVITDEYIACFVAGTRLATEKGEIPVEQIRPGDLLRTAAGPLRPVRWVGQRAYDGRFIKGNVDVLPIVLTAGALAESIPQHDLMVSPGHAFLIDGVLVAARYLVNGHSIRQLPAVDTVHYYHVELDRHDIVLAEGAPAESYHDTGNRACFLNGLAWLTDHPNVVGSASCAEYVQPGPQLTAIRQRLFGRSRQKRVPQYDLQVTAWRGAERRVLVPDRLSSDRWWFAVPVGATALRLTSAPHVPMWTDAASLDSRPLGVSLLAIEINGCTLSWDSPLLAEGFYGCEGAGANIWRWTNGDALLKLPTGALTVVLQTPDRFDFATQADAA